MTKPVALYHTMRPYEGFDVTAQRLFDILKKAASEHPGRPRHLYLDVEGHRNQARGFDHDAYEIMVHFVIGFLGRWLTGINMPLLCATTGQQDEDVPDQLTIELTH
jgi:hypothetical protein